jgi:succinate dehydrogenase / fumarate reductase cytochrome b subunit
MASSPDKRPTSPHLTIYRPQISSVLSISHRISGVALYAGTLALAWWLWTLAYDPYGYEAMRECMNSVLGRIALIGWTLAFYYHFSNGLRHLFWDMGYGYSLPSVNRSGWAAVYAAIGLTALTWYAIISGGF